MFDGENDGPTMRTSDALLRIVDELGGLKQALRTVVTHEKLITILNEQRKEVIGSVRDSESHLKGVVEAQSILNDKRHQDLQVSYDTRVRELFGSIDRMFSDKIDMAVARALEAREKQENKARVAIENKAKDEVRGLRILMWAAGPMLFISLTGCAVMAWKLFFDGGLG